MEENKATQVQTTATPTVPTAGVDLDLHAGKSLKDLMATKAQDLSPDQVMDPYNKAASVIEQISQNANNQIASNSRETIGTDRGGQRALLTGVNDTYMTSRYSSPIAASIASQIRTTAAQAGLQHAMKANMEKAEERYKKARDAAESRARARAAAASAGSGNGEFNPTSLIAGDSGNPHDGSGFAEIDATRDKSALEQEINKWSEQGLLNDKNLFSSLGYAGAVAKHNTGVDLKDTMIANALLGPIGALGVGLFQAANHKKPAASPPPAANAATGAIGAAANAVLKQKK